MSRQTPRVVAILVALSVLGGCDSVQKQLENVAKDWCMTIRASQVIPVYPLTEDLQPGDVFLVTVPVQKQATIYKEKGFLPLDLAVTRLAGLDYGTYYASAYWEGDFAQTPHRRMVRDLDEKGGTSETANPATPASLPTPTNPGTPASPAAEATVAFDLSRGLGAPRAAFPTYTFKVEKGSGARLAIPVQGVPIALGFMSASSAVGSVTISDAYTYAAPTESLMVKLKDWAAAPGTRQTLEELQEQNPGTLYLRVVQRVYLTGGVVVSVTNEKALGGGGEADLSVLGAASPFVAPETPETPVAESAGGGAAGSEGGDGQPPASSGGVPSGTKLTDVNAALSEALSDKTPGASLKILQASSRSVSMKENFDRPLVIGYIGFDFPILEDGDLGVPIATLNQLEKREAKPTHALLGIEQSRTELSYNTIFDKYAALESSGNEELVQISRVFVIDVTDRIDEPAVSGPFVDGVYVRMLRQKLNVYLSTESNGEGPRHEKVLEAVREASKQE